MDDYRARQAVTMSDKSVTPDGFDAWEVYRADDTIGYVIRIAATTYNAHVPTDGTLRDTRYVGTRDAPRVPILISSRAL